MAGKAPVFCNGGLSFAMDSLSKNTLIDLVVDRARAEIGEDASDEAIAAQVQEWIGPVCRERGDKAPNLVASIRNWEGKRQRYLDRERQKQERNAALTNSVARIVERVKEWNEEKLKTEPYRWS